MKKLQIAAVITGALLSAAAYVYYAVRFPARTAERYLAAINGLTVGNTSEAELLRRSVFQTVDRACFEAFCTYHMHVDNTFLNKLHLAPRMSFAAMVSVSDGMVAGVTVFVIEEGRTPISLVQVSEMPSWCSASPCMRTNVLPNMMKAGISVLISRDSFTRNHMPEAVNSGCLSRIHGCSSYAELMPMTRDLNIESFDGVISPIR